MKSKILILIIGIVVVLVGGFGCSKVNNPQDNTTGTNGGSGNAELSSIEVLPSGKELCVGGSIKFEAIGKNGNSSTVEVVPVWEVKTGSGTIDAAGIFTAGNKPENVIISASSGNVSGSVSLNVITGPIYTVALEPSTASLDVGQTVQFSIKTSDFYGNNLEKELTWQVVQSGQKGSISNGGLFKALALGTCQIEIKDGAKTIASANVSVKENSIGNLVLGMTGAQIESLYGAPPYGMNDWGDRFEMSYSSNKVAFILKSDNFSMDSPVVGIFVGTSEAGGTKGGIKVGNNRADVKDIGLVRSITIGTHSAIWDNWSWMYAIM
ncbi:MAG: hypothetical protein FD145_1528 [Candidatus Saganbacteria bacterium]|uniref:BIG2 domain-containing protein n=1 Tax=Candidatus Saganbacteria bacterium TaxID=2575572 RepID=A0A833KZQ9_UNCSA|nr:MAG: hypothetical protein FD145_1528 [Candidatus Saganbacteria bacterium]